ncbi:uncharacterized protein [Eurosta solidaginis]|uniref:uncharacterized protein n=1 Tax=Eurosta solidaginis TaxID=178769 RepID=UPI0035313141
MSFEAATHRQFDLPWDKASDEPQELETDTKHSALIKPTCKEKDLPIQNPLGYETHTGQQTPGPSAKRTEDSRSSHTLFGPQHTKSIRQIGSNLYNEKHAVNANSYLPNPVSYNLVQQIIQTIGELESTLLDDQQNDFNLRLEYELQTQKLKDLCHSLENEKERNVRLMELIRGVDPSSSVDEEELDNALSRSGTMERWSRSSNAYESISPLLMQQRYDELSYSYKQCRKQLIKKEKLLKLSKCETETAKARYDNLLDEYKSALMRIEQLCLRYLQLQARKNLEIHRLYDALNCASDSIGNAQQLIDCLDEETVTIYMKEKDNNSDSNNETNETDYNIAAFKQNLELFVKSLRLCQWVQHTNKNANDNDTIPRN